MTTSNETSETATTGPVRGPAAALARWRGARIWVVGDAMLDTWVRGDAGRISPEAPVPVVRVSERAASLGGAAHVARSVEALGGAVTLAGVVGDDAAAAELIALCAHHRVDAAALAVTPGRPTTSKVRVVAHGQQLVRFDTEDDAALDDAATDAIIAALGDAPEPAAIVVSDYAKGVVGPRLFAWLAGVAQGLGVPLLVDPKRPDFAAYRGATVITPNAREFVVAAGAEVDLDDDGALGSAAARIAERAGDASLVVTLGPRGMAVWRPDGPVARVGVTARRVYDVTGAGDTVMATLALGLVAGLSLVEAAELANRAAGLAVERPGAALITAADLAHGLAPPPRTLGPTGREDLEARLAWWRLRGDRIVFTNGCFDLIHTGHLSLLRQAASFGDVLVVGLNSDDSVGRLKGPTRPLNNAEDRAEILTALTWVDAVVIFDEDTPLELLRVVRPDVLVKGADYRLDQVVGRDEVESWGGRVELARLVEERSTTRLVERMRTEEQQG